MSVSRRTNGSSVTAAGADYRTSDRNESACRELQFNQHRKHIAARRQPDIVTIMYGTNDSYVDQGKTTSRLTVDEYRNNLQTIVVELLRREFFGPDD